MLDLVNRYANGYVALRVALACRNHGLLPQPGPGDVGALARAHKANEGPLRVALRLLFELGWTDRLDPTRVPYRLPSNVDPVVDIDWRATFEDHDEGAGVSWIRRWLGGWQGFEPALSQLIEGALAAPLLVELHRSQRHHLHDAEVRTPIWSAIRELFVRLDWATVDERGFRTTEAGDYMIHSGAHLGTLLSYAPLFNRMDDILFGDYRAVFARDSGGHETHIDRALNVISSGQQHQTYFAALEDAVVGYFNTLHVADQPACIVDMGCGDGTLLARLYRAVCSRTSRANQMDRFPLRVVGADFNAQALEEAARTLADVPHVLVEADVGDPARLLEDLGRFGISADDVLHVRSFLDHDRGFQPPADERELAARARHAYTGVYVARDGRSIAPAAAVQSLVEHLRRWRPAVSRHGLTLLEVHNVTPETVRADPHGSECLHFDAYHAFSGQQLVEAPVFLMAAAEAGLFPDPAVARSYPRTLGFTRISLNRFEARPFVGRHPHSDDLPALLDLEARCLPEYLRTPAAELERRITHLAAGAVVIERDGHIVAAAYSQRSPSLDAVRGSRYEDAARLADPHGRYVQLLGLNVDPAWQSDGLGDQLLTFMLQYFSVWEGVDGVVGVTRCRDYRSRGETDFEAYVNARDSDGRPVDPILRFHVAHGARIEGILPGFRAEDADNVGAGILIAYDPVQRTPYVEPPRDRAHAPDTESVVHDAILTVLGPDRRAAYRSDAPFMEMGLQSLDLLELRHLLSTRLGTPLETSFFFRFGTPTAVVDFLSRGAASIPAPVSAAGDKDDEDGYAIVGMACRMPGGADTPEAYWDLLERGVDAVDELSPDRRALFEAQSPVDLGDLPLRAGLVDSIDQFDADFFHISPREAGLLDPQQRFLLEIAWEALENAGLNARRLEGGSGGVFIGAISRDYESLLLRSGAGRAGEAWVPTGNASSMAAGRLAYFLNWHGPALTLDTACSSSLVAVHQACRALQHGECDLALAGGVNLLLAPETSLAYWRAGMLSPDGRCKTFDASANGYVRGEGCGLVVIKRLRDAVTDGDRILAVVRGTAVNQDGAGTGLTAPNQQAQEELIKSALRDARVAPADVDYLEAHGTGTSLGDPVELNAALAVLGHGRAADRPLLVGSVKTNIGHLEAAAGVAGLIKVVLAMQHATVPRQLHFDCPNPLIAWAELPVRVVAETQAWPAARKRPIAGISAFGFSGTNAHVIVEGPPAEVLVSRAASEGGSGETADGPTYPLVVSTRNVAALRESAGRYRQWLEAHPNANLADVCYTLSECRTQFEVRVTLGVRSIPEACDLLGQLERGERVPEPTAAAPADFGPGKRQKLALPTYPFQRKRFWADVAVPASPVATTNPGPPTELLYHLEWRPLPPPPPAQASGSWAVIGHPSPLATALAHALAEHGASVASDLGQLTSPTTTVYLVPDAGPDLATINALVQHPHVVRLHLVTRGAWDLGNDGEVLPHQRLAWGLGKVLSLEQPARWGSLIDLPSETEPSSAEALLGHLLATDGEDQLALRGGQRFAARLVHLPTPASDPGTPLAIRADATYLVTGGLGRVGLQLAEWLAARGAGHVVLVGRQPPSESARAHLESLSGRFACHVHVRAADVAQPDQVRDLLAELASQLPPLRGILHAAGVLAEAALGDHPQATFEAVLAPKVHGAWLLHQLSLDLPLDFFICLSSIAAVWGSPRQAAYAAANAFLDGLAAFRQQRGLPALSISFGPWGPGGMADRRARDELARQGVRSLGARRALAALEALASTASTSPEAVVADVDWPVFQAIYQARRERRLLVELPVSPPDPAPTSTTPTPLVDALGAEPASQRRKLLEQHLRQTLGTILAIPPHELDPDVGFTDLGLDSMMAVQLRKRLQLDLGAALALPVTIAFDYPSVHQLATFVLDQLYPVEVEAPELDEFQQKLLEIQTTSSEDELDALLETNLKALGAD